MLFQDVLIGYTYNLSQFNQQYYTLAESILCSIIIILSVNLFLIIGSLYCSFTAKKQKILAFCFLFLVIYALYESIYHYLNDNLDYQRNFLGNIISVRNIVISSGVDLSIWLLYQIYIMLKYPNTMFLTSKLTINWVN